MDAQGPLDQERERRERDGPEPVEFDGYMIHVFRDRLWLVPIDRDAPVTTTRQ